MLILTERAVGAPRYKYYNRDIQVIKRGLVGYTSLCVDQGIDELAISDKLWKTNPLFILLIFLLYRPAYRLTDLCTLQTLHNADSRTIDRTIVFWKLLIKLIEK